jgi:hypothetical protein
MRTRKGGWKKARFACVLIAIAIAPTHSAATQNGAVRVGGGKAVLWQNPGPVEQLDLAGGPGGVALAPAPPFTFVEEDTSGSNPKIQVRDARGVEWGVKWGNEVNAEVFTSRLAWAVGYFVEPSYYVATGKIEGVTTLVRAREYVAADGTFKDARFELKAKRLKKFAGEDSWRWDRNLFGGSRELNGLRVMMMLVSNWDSKDERDADRGSNTKIYVFETRDGSEFRYVVSDWGGSMGKWGGVMKREKWDCEGFAKQTPGFVLGVSDGLVRFGYEGQHTDAIRDGITVSDVRWLLGYLTKLSDKQIREALRASGASAKEEECFARSIRDRIAQLQAIR